MFAKKDTRVTRKDSVYQAKPAPSSSSAPAPRMNPGMPSILAEDIRITGDLKGDGEIQIEGTIEGNVEGTEVTVGPTGTVNGTIKAVTVTVSGALEGEIKAETVSLSDGAQVNGNVTVADTFAIAPGAHFEGKAIRAAQAHKAPSLSSYDGGKKKDDAMSSSKSDGNDLPKVAAK